MKKIHILLVENRENEIEFFTDALKESGLSFFCSTARNTEDAFLILKNSVPDAVFIDANMIKSDTSAALKKIKSVQKAPLILYSTIANTKLRQGFSNTVNYVQLPANVKTMARVLKNLFIDNEIRDQSSALAEA